MRGQSEDTKLCRAIGCRRRIADTRIFCSTHFGILPTKDRTPVQENREPTGTDATAAQSITAGAAAAVASIARIEGKAGDHRRAAKRGNTLQTGGSSYNSGSEGLSRSRFEFDSTVKLQEL